MKTFDLSLPLNGRPAPESVTPSTPRKGIIVRLLERSLGSFFTKHLLLHKKKLAITMGVLITQALLAVVSPLPLKFILDRVLTGKGASGVLATLTPVELLGVGVVLFLLAQGAGLLFEMLELLWLTRTSNSVVESARKDVAKVFATRRHDFISGKRKADLVGRLSQDTSNMDILLQMGLTVLVRAFPSVIFVGVILTSVNAWFALLIFCVIVTMLFLTTHFARRVKKYRKLFRADITNFEQVSLQSLQAYSLSKASKLGFSFRVRMARSARLASNHIYQGAVSEAMLANWMASIKAFLKVLIVAGGGYLVLQGELTAGTIVLFLSYIDTVGKAMNDLNKFAQKSARSFASLDRLQEILAEAEAYPEPVMGRASLAAPVHSLDFRNVTFGYHPESPTINQFSHRFLSGELTALCGPSGSGKSTILYLAKRFYAPQSGEIAFDQQNIADVEGRFFRYSVHYTAQDIQVLRGTIRDNICYDQSRVFSDEQIWAALESANADGFVRELSLGLDTVVGDGGQSLSFGQAKRICLARAFTPSPASIFLFDEPTSGLDRESAVVVLKSIRNLSERGALVIFTTHTQEDLAFAHSSISIDNGQELILS